MGLSVTAMMICLAPYGANPPTSVAEDQVDLVEINHFHDDQGRPVFDQIIFYDWSPAHGRYQVRDWRLLKSSNQVPLSNTRDREFIAVWSDYKTRDVLRSTKARIMHETWTQYDPELVERDFLPENKRRRLTDMQPKVATAGGGTGTRSLRTQVPSSPSEIRPLQTPNSRPGS